MIKVYFILLLSYYLINSNPIQQNGWNICQLDGYFNPSNGYQWFIVNHNTTICTCPDKLQSTINRPCRICDRDNVCGLNEAFCSEESTFFNTSNENHHYVCFCPSGLFSFDKKCSKEIIDETTSSTNQIEETTNTLVTDISIEEISTDSMSTTVSLDEITNIISMTSTNSIQQTSQILSTEPSKTISSTKTTTSVNSSSSSHRLINTYFIILLNIFYFSNK